MQAKTACVFLLVCAVGVLSQNPGLQVRITEKGLNYASRVVLALLPEMVNGQQLPPVNGKAGVVVGDVHYSINRIKLQNFNLGSISKVVSNGAVNVAMNNLQTRARGYWSYSYRLAFISVGDSGTFEANVRSTNLNLGVRIGEQGGRATASVTSCSANVGNLQIRLSGGASWLYNIFIGLVVPILKNEVSKAICDGVRDMIRAEVNPALAQIKLEVPLAELGKFDFHMTRQPSFTNNYVETYHRGRFLINGHNGQPPFHPSPFPSAGVQSKMLTVWVSDFVINSLLFLLHKHEVLQVSINPDMLPDESKDVLNLSCDDICFGKILPLDVQEKYPDGVASIHLKTTKYPVVNVVNGQLSAVIEAEMQVSILDEETWEEEFLFAANVNASVAGSASMSPKRGFFEVSSMSVKLAVTDSQFESIRSSSLNLLLRIGINGVLIPEINKMGKEGLAFPDLQGISISNPELLLLKNSVVVKTDGTFTI